MTNASVPLDIQKYFSLAKVWTTNHTFKAYQFPFFWFVINYEFFGKVNPSFG